MTIPYQAFAIALSVIGVALWVVVIGISTVRARRASGARLTRLTYGAMLVGFLAVAILTLIAALALDLPIVAESGSLGRLAVSFIRGIVVVVPAYMILLYWHFDHEAAEGQQQGDPAVRVKPERG